jgi:ribose 5-phosphate isomerase B
VIAVGADDNGFALKEAILEALAAKGLEVIDAGPSRLESVDYPDIAIPVAMGVAEGTYDRGVLVCGTGLGMAIAANKVPGVFAACVTTELCAERARSSNDTTVLCLGAQVLGQELALRLVDIWLSTDFKGGRSARKVGKIAAFERSAARLDGAREGRRIASPAGARR